jgi:hypothetical protein
MHFYVDESGHTGPNIFDSNQPTLYYGVLSSAVNVDVLASDRLRVLRKRAGVARIHAAELGNAGLLPLVGDLAAIQRDMSLRFDLYRLTKRDHAIICFFDQVFDQGMNPAMTWTGYWTPMRYVLLLKVASLFDERLAKLAWQARLELDDTLANRHLTELCHQLTQRLHSLPDARSRQLIGDTLGWAAEHPGALFYNAKTKNDQLAVMPNIIGFQSVMVGIAARLKKVERRAARIVVDQQSQFNKAQRTLHDYYIRASKVTLMNGPGLPEIDFSGVPNVPIEFIPGTESCGLELVDVYLWVFRRMFEATRLAPEFWQLIAPQGRRGITSEISLAAIEQRWTRWFDSLPEPTEEQMARGRAMFAMDEARRLQGML